MVSRNEGGRHVPDVAGHGMLDPSCGLEYLSTSRRHPEGAQQLPAQVPPWTVHWQSKVMKSNTQKWCLLTWSKTMCRFPRKVKIYYRSSQLWTLPEREDISVYLFILENSNRYVAGHNTGSFPGYLSSVSTSKVLELITCVFQILLTGNIEGRVWQLWQGTVPGHCIIKMLRNLQPQDNV